MSQGTSTMRHPVLYYLFLHFISICVEIWLKIIIVIFSVDTIMGKIKLDFVLAKGELNGLTNFSITNLVTDVEQSTTDVTLHYDSVFVSSKSDNL